ncbi:MAG: filamentous hemagglutinin N-terminal domain-containing protein, partial [Rhodocyclaceae bacterium]
MIATGTNNVPQHPLAGRSARKIIALSVALAVSPAALALPLGESVVSGSVAVSRPDAQNMVVRQGSSKAIVNWQGFSIGGGENVAFRQPGASSVILNRVVGGSPSDILGRITANGQVFLVNPNGVFFAPGASADVGSLVASTLNIADADFLAGRYRFAGSGTPGTVSNQGSLQAAQGGTVALLGGQVSNDGTLTAQLGTVALAAGNRVTLDFAGDGLTKLTVDEATVGAQVRNSGMIIADGGQAVLTAHAAQALADTVINQQGLVRARSLTARNGRIVLDGGEHGATLVSGSLDASGRESGQTGGTVSVMGYHVGLTEQASIDASGSAGGGTVLIGGDYQGNNPAVRNAAATYFSPQARISADALQTGNGGKVILWSDGPTRAYGTISARGGANGGNGGLVETSGHWLDVAGARVSAAAPAGVAGSWLLDPGNITISHSTVPVSAIPGNGMFSTEGPPTEDVSV